MLTQFAGNGNDPAPVASLVATQTEQVTAVRTRCDISFEIFTDLSRVENDWRAFEAEADCTAFQTFAWLSAWQRTIGAATGTRPAVIVGKRRQRTFFLIPLAVDSGRRLTWLGRAMCDYNAPLLAGDFGKIVDASEFPALWRDIVGAVRHTPGLAFDSITLDKMPATVGTQDNPFLALPVMAHPSGAYFSRLSGDWESYYTAKRSSTTRRRDRTKRKGLAQFGEVRFETATEKADIARTLDTLFAQKSRSLRAMGAVDIFARPEHRAFYVEAATGLADTPVHVSRLAIAGDTAAANLGLWYRGRYYHVLASYTEGPAARFGPGAAHLQELIRYAIDGGGMVFDFTVGDEAYKRDWCECAIKLYDHRSAVTMRGWIRMLPGMAGAAIKRFIKQTPILWRASTALRTLLAQAKQRLRPTPRSGADEEPS